ncbi:MAG TPA: ABC transporter permease [Ktedonobacteraceae bacterium]|nr:ABC transporter permease [Ktedonobacteraceae bacterium]
MMNTTTLTSTGQHIRSIERPRPLLSVTAWELRRCGASRLFWFQALGFFCLVLFLTWASRAPNQFGNMNGSVSAFVAGTSPWGLLTNLPLVLVLLGLLLPFITTDSVTRDLSRRTHELLLTTALPTWAYVWGRYLACLLLSLGLAVLSLAALLGLGWLLHLTTANYPAPESGALLLLWVGMILSATVLLSSLGFALGTLLPRLSMLVKVVILLGWVIGAVILPIGLRDATPPAWYVNWDPTSAVTALGIIPQYLIRFQNQTGTITNAAQIQQILLTFENRMPNLSGWFAPHLLLAGASLALVLIAALAFKRSREVLN